MAAVGEIILFITWVAVLVLLARFIIDWVQVLARSWRPRGAVAALCEAIFTITDPPLGGALLDLSPMVLLIAIYIVQILVRATML